MKGKTQSTMFRFVLSNQDTMKNLDQLKLDNYNRFVNTCYWGKQIQQLSKSEQQQTKLSQFIDKHMFDIPYMKFQIQDAFVSAFNLKNQNIVGYFLRNGINIDQLIQDSAISLCYSLEYSSNDPPISLMKTILEYGANARFAQSRESQTAMHIACKYGSLELVKLLIEYKADINAVDNNKKTPLNYAIQHGNQDLIQYLKNLNASDDWKK